MMNLPDDTLPDRPVKRFIVGFCVAGLVAFLVVVFDSDTIGKSIMNASGTLVIVGAIAGTLAAFGKKLLRYIIALAAEIISNP